MQQAKAIAIAAAPPFNPFLHALDSFSNSVHWLLDRLYGTQDRVRITYSLAFALAGLGYALSINQSALLNSCLVMAGAQ